MNGRKEVLVPKSSQRFLALIKEQKKRHRDWLEAQRWPARAKEAATLVRLRRHY